MKPIIFKSLGEALKTFPLADKIFYARQYDNVIETPLPLVYADNDKLYAVSSYIDTLKDLIVGIKVENFVVCKDQLVNNRIIADRKFLKECSLCGQSADYPALDELFALSDIYVSDFNKTIQILQTNGLEASFFNQKGEYWIKDVYQDKAILYDFVYGREKVCDFEEKAGILLIWRPDEKSFEKL